MNAWQHAEAWKNAGEGIKADSNSISDSEHRTLMRMLGFLCLRVSDAYTTIAAKGQNDD